MLNTLDDLYTSVNFALKSCALPERSKQEVRAFLGNGLKRLMERAVPEGSDEATVARAISAFSEHYDVHKNDTTRPYDGIEKLLSDLKECGFKVGVVSNKNDTAVKPLCRDFFGDKVDVAIGASATVAVKPSPGGVFEALKELGSSVEESVYVGDSETDFLTAQNTGIDFIGVTWGFRDKGLLVGLGAKTVVDSPDEILEILKFF